MSSKSTVYASQLKDAYKVYRSLGEVWLDKAGNECFFRDDGTISCRTVNDEPTLTIQSERDKCDLNIIKTIYDRTGVMNNVRTDAPRYGDFSSSDDYHSMVLRAQEAQDDFMQLPADLRARFSNDPGKLIEFVRNPNNALEAVKLGLMTSPGDSPQANQVPQGDVASPSKDGV
ncbi:MAG: internal scaffolding protein [Microviridae sp.]|nr:MAG: internal scaffolding protein [Microviridae sp.]